MRPLSPTEKEIMQVLWLGKELKVREIYERLRKKHIHAALTSIAVMLDRLYKNGLVERRVEQCRGGLRYIYKSKVSKEKTERLILKSTVDNIIKRFGPAAASYFNERFGKKR
ncbi:MAG: BlaI/MecI/CopY family transcriptional regulator [Candidatus Marsarchaeota archaeon]|nr:BlaI/MecI/CopY family transcriptional regulator [Candidatus Marsarchaeota archaeon]